MLPDKQRFRYLDFTDGGILSIGVLRFTRKPRESLFTDQARGMWIMRRSSRNSLVTLFRIIYDRWTRVHGVAFRVEIGECKLISLLFPSIVQPENWILNALSSSLVLVYSGYTCRFVQLFFVCVGRMARYERDADFETNRSIFYVQRVVIILSNEI